MFDYTHCRLQKVSVHHVPNKQEGNIVLSDNPLDVSDSRLSELLLQFFLHSFTSSEYYSFTFSNEDHTMNPMYQFAVQFFDNSRSFHRTSTHVAKHLYELSSHPQIKSGDLFVAYFPQLSMEEGVIDAIGIFKSEQRQSFLKLTHTTSEFLLQCEDGIGIEKLDKGCLIWNTQREEGFKVSIVDKANRSTEAQFWKDQFLQLRPLKNEFHFTRQFMNITKNYVTQQLSEEFVVNKADQIDMLNRSMEYFKSHDNFSKKEFEKEVLQDQGIIKSFRKFDQDFRERHDIELDDDFEISSQAVKKQSRVFKSVLKLDKNFHIYIHGNRELIEQGTDEDGRKFYKIYYKEER